MEPLDLLLVVGMFLTGFDAKKLNTLYVDKNLEYHGLLQAFSRTNRVVNEKKRFGKIICFRDLKDNVDAAIKLFSNNNPTETILREPFERIKKEFNDLAIKFKEKYPDVQSIDNLKSEYAKRDFVLAFREIIKKRAEIQIYEDFESDDEDFILSEQEFMDFRSKYLDITIGCIEPTVVPQIVSGEEVPYGDERTLEDIDFCLELLHSDVINVAYILSLIVDLDPASNDYQEKRQQILDTMIKDAALRNKTKLIDGFMRQNIDNDKVSFSKAKADGSVDLESRLTEYVNQERSKAVHELSEEEDIEEAALVKFLNEYYFLQKEKTDILQEAIKKKKVGLKERRSLLKRLTEKLRIIINLFDWK